MQMYRHGKGRHTHCCPPSLLCLQGSYVASYSGKKLMLCDVEAENFYKLVPNVSVRN